jgi:hypothetical protein
MDRMRKTALIAGVLYLVTFVAGIPPALALYSDVLHNPAYILSSADDTAVLWGGLLELINAFACVGTAVVLFPVVKRQSEAAALGFVTSRMIEAAVIIVGILSLLSVVTLHQDLAGAAATDAAALVTTGHALVAIYNWALLLGPGIMPAVNALLLGSLMYRSGLVPRLIPAMGLIGAPLLLASAISTMFGLNEQVSLLSAVAVVPIFFWELSLGLYMAVKGFKPSPLTPGSVPAAPVPGPMPVA